MFSPGFGRDPPSPGCDFTGLVAWSLLAPRSWKPPCQSTPFARSVVHWRWCGADDSLPFVSSLSAARFGLWPSGLAIAALPLVSRPWTGLCWSHLLSLSSGGSVQGIPRQLAGSGVYSPASPFALLLACCSGVPSGSLLQVSHQVFAMGSPYRVVWSSIGTKSLPPPSWCLVWVFAMGSPCLEVPQISIGTKTFCAPSLVVGV